MSDASDAATDNHEELRVRKCCAAVAAALREAEEALARGERGRYALEVGRAGGEAFAGGLRGIASDHLFDDISDAFENHQPDGLAAIRRHAVDLTVADEAAHRVLPHWNKWQEVGAAINEARLARDAEDRGRYSLMIGFACGVTSGVFGDEDHVGIIKFLVRGYEEDSSESISRAASKAAAGVRFTSYGVASNDELETIRRAQNFGVRLARRGDDSVRVLNSTLINWSLHGGGEGREGD